MNKKTLTEAETLAIQKSVCLRLLELARRHGFEKTFSLDFIAVEHCLPGDQLRELLLPFFEGRGVLPFLYVSAKEAMSIGVVLHQAPFLEKWAKSGKPAPTIAHAPFPCRLAMTVGRFFGSLVGGYKAGLSDAKNLVTR